LERSDARLLPGFDEYLLGYTERGAVLAREYAEQIAPGGNGIFRPMLVMGGEVRGTWRRTVKKKGVEMRLEPFGAQAVDEAALRQAAQRYCDFMELALIDFQLEDET